MRLFGLSCSIGLIGGRLLSSFYSHSTSFLSNGSLDTALTRHSLHRQLASTYSATVTLPSLRLSPPAWLPFTVSSQMSTLTRIGVAGPIPASRGALPAAMLCDAADLAQTAQKPRPLPCAGLACSLALLPIDVQQHTVSTAGGTAQSYVTATAWRSGGDSNPRRIRFQKPFSPGGFQDRCLQPLDYHSVLVYDKR